MSEETKTRETPCAFIDDGYTLPFFIAEVPGRSQAISGHRRPFTPRERTELVHLMDKAHNDSEKLNKVACEAMLKHMVDWDVKSRDGNAVPLTVENLGRINPLGLWNRLFETIVGTADDDTTEAMIINTIRTQPDIDKAVAEIERLLKARKENVAIDPLKN